MINDERVVALVPARGGSKTVPGKNLRTLDDRPLVAWPIDVAHDTPAIDRVLVTTDDDDIAAVAREYGAGVIDRPDRLASDDALVIDAIRHTIGELRGAGESAVYLVLLEPTCPFRAPQDVHACLDLLASGYDSAATFVEAAVNPHRTWTIDDDHPEPFVDGANPWRPRQELPEAYQLSGGAYAFEIDGLPDEDTSLLFGRTGAVVVPPERSVDVDTELDLAFARLLVEREHG